MASASVRDDEESNKSNHTTGLASGFLGKTGNDEVPLDKTYYNCLNVSPTATATEIKRSYYALSLQYHPDRTQDLNDLTRQEYAERFKLMSQAYSILSDPQQRTLYNRYGRDERYVSNGGDGISLEDFDAERFFRLLFGGEEFLSIVGDFELPKVFNHVVSDMLHTTEQTQNGGTAHPNFMEERTVAREVRIQELSENLISKLAIFTDVFQSDHEEHSSAQALDHFTEIMRLDLVNLLEASYGEQLLHAIGYIYSSKARFWSSKMDSQEGHIGKRLLGFGKHVRSSWKDRVHVVKETVKTVKSVVQCQQSMSKLAQVTDKDSNELQFQHHSGHLEYSGFVPSDSAEHSASPAKEKPHRKSSGQPVVPLTDEEKQKLEADTATKSMEALWRATKLELESIERAVCDRVLTDSSCSRDVRRRRCIALSQIGDLWQHASPSTTA